MLTAEQNEILVRVGPGTQMGSLMRQFWIPGLLSEELPEPDCAPVRLRLLGEDLIAFRDSNGNVGILDAYCPHRRAPMYYGRNEECGLRCVYHGWKFDINGKCVDMPSEPDGSTLAEKVKMKAYKAIERNDVVWIYMGPSDHTPELPQFEWSRLNAKQTTATKRHQRCNWAQAVEGGIDSAHVSFLHSATEKQIAAGKARILPNSQLVADRHPVFEVVNADHGLIIAARRSAGESEYYWRISQFLLPFYSMIPPVSPARDSRESIYQGHAWVPIDDHNTWTWTFGASPKAALTPEQREFHGGKSGMWGPVDDKYEPLLNMDNEYKLDREAQKTYSFTGISGIPNEDAAMQEGMGPIVDRSQEFLGSSDRGVVSFRRLMIGLAQDAARGIICPASRNGAAYNIRSASVLLDRSVDFRDGAAWLLRGLSDDDIANATDTGADENTKRAASFIEHA